MVSFLLDQQEAIPFLNPLLLPEKRHKLTKTVPVLLEKKVTTNEVAEAGLFKDLVSVRKKLVSVRGAVTKDKKTKDQSILIICKTFTKVIIF